MLGELVKVVWNDAHGSVGTVSYALHEIPHEPIEVTSYGILLKQDEVGVSIASEKCGDDTWRGYTFIPASMLIKVIAIKKPRKPKVKQAPPGET